MAASYRYTGSNLTGRTDIDGAVTTFTYSSGQVLIATVNSRTTTVALDVATNKLTQITNPDAGVHTFAYDTNKRLLGDTARPELTQNNFPPFPSKRRTC
jgi:YD repeat-containing protein